MQLYFIYISAPESESDESDSDGHGEYREHRGQFCMSLSLSDDCLTIISWGETPRSKLYILKLSNTFDTFTMI